MNVIVIGLGSMGSRRIRLLCLHFPKLNILGVDISQKRCDKAREKYQINTCQSLSDALVTSCDYAFICTSPLSHAELILQCLDTGLHVFTEINLVSDEYERIISSAKEKNKTIFLSSTFLYRSETRYIIEQVSEQKRPLSYTYHVGQYLPDWHPWETINDFFVSDKRTGGCREILAIELPWLFKAFGKVKHVSAQSRTMSSLKLPYPDTYLIHIEHETGTIGQLMVDVVTRIPVRHFEVFGENLQLEWRGTPDKLWRAVIDNSIMQKIDTNFGKTPDKQESYREFITEDAYLEEIEAFFAVIEGTAKPIYTFEDDMYTLKIVDEIMGESN